jgi:hypothetical protein
MSGAAQQLRDLLAPLGVYRWEGSFQWGELQSEGEALDGAAADLRRVQREMSLATAEEEGLEMIRSLLRRPPDTEDPAALRAALAALLRVGGGSFTLEAMNDTLTGCGIPAVAEETGDPLHLVVRFPDCEEEPADFDRLRGIVEDILPCHLLIEYQFGDGTSEEEG